MFVSSRKYHQQLALKEHQIRVKEDTIYDLSREVDRLRKELWALRGIEGMDKSQ